MKGVIYQTCGGVEGGCLRLYTCLKTKEPNFPLGLVTASWQEEQETSYTILRARGCNVTLNGLKANTAYLLQIRARTAAGYGASSPSFQFETSPDCESLLSDVVLCTFPRHQLDSSRRAFISPHKRLADSCDMLRG